MNMFFKNYYNLNKLINNLKTFDDVFLKSISDIKGTEYTEKGTSESGDWEKKTFISEDGTFSYTFYTNKSDQLKGENYGKYLETKLQEAVDKQDFESAVVFRDKLKTIETDKLKIEELEKELTETIKSQNFERSIEIRDEINKLKLK